MGRGRYPGEFEQVVLLALAGLGAASTGRDVYDRIVATVDRDPSVAAIHITLVRMVEKGWVDSTSHPPAPHEGGKPRKRYTLSASGAAILAEQRRELERLWGNAASHPLFEGGDA